MVPFLAVIIAPAWVAAGCPAGDLAGCRAQCEKGNAESCASLGSIYREGTSGVARDEARAVELYRNACTHGSREGCANLRRMYREGRGFSGKRPR